MDHGPQLIVGHVMHKRLRPLVNGFVYPVFYLHLPLRDLGAAECALFSVDRANVLSVHQRDHRPRDGALIAVLAEVNNTFGGHHHYLLHNPGGAPLRDGQELRSSKAFHVSTFNRIEGGYRFPFHLDGALRLARIDYDDAEGELLRTAISGHAQTWSMPALLRALLRMPLLTLGVTLRIHWQALKLWLKGVRFHGARVDQPLNETKS